MKDMKLEYKWLVGIVYVMALFMDLLDMTVTNDGEGFDVERVRGTGSGLGLVSMDERAHAFGGEVHID